MFEQCLNDIYIIDRPVLNSVLEYLDIAYTIIFGIEMILKMVSLGLKTYFTTVWNLLDFAIVMVRATDHSRYVFISREVVILLHG